MDSCFPGDNWTISPGTFGFAGMTHERIASFDEEDHLQKSRS